MAATTGSGSSNPSSAPPKILLAKPGLNRGGGAGGSEDESVTLRSRLPPLASLNLLSDSWEFHTDRILQFLTENTDFTVVGVIGSPGVGKSTILNELYGFDATSAGMLPPFATQMEETRAMARHCTVGMELRVSAERLILLDTQPIFSPSVLAEMMRPDGSTTISVLHGESLSADLAHELMGIQVDLLKHGIPDPSSLTSSYSQGSNLGHEKEIKDTSQEVDEEYLATPIFVHTKLREQDLSPINTLQLRRALLQYLSSSSFMEKKYRNNIKDQINSSGSSDNKTDDLGSAELELFLIPSKCQDDSQRIQCESYISTLGKLRDLVLSTNCRPFAKAISEREWLRNSARIWEIVKNSPVIAEYSKTLQSSGMFRR